MAQQKKLSTEQNKSKKSLKVKPTNSNTNRNRVEGVILPKKTINKITKDITAIILEKYSGPLPHPEHFRKYEEVLSGTADRIIKMAEKITQGNIDLNKKRLKTENLISVLTSVFAFIVAIAGFGVAFFAISKGANLEGVAIILAEITALIYAFLKGKKDIK